MQESVLGKQKGRVGYVPAGGSRKRETLASALAFSWATSTANCLKNFMVSFPRVKESSSRLSVFETHPAFTLMMARDLA